MLCKLGVERGIQVNPTWRRYQSAPQINAQRRPSLGNNWFLGREFWDFLVLLARMNHKLSSNLCACRLHDDYPCRNRSEQKQKKTAEKPIPSEVLDAALPS